MFSTRQHFDSANSSAYLSSASAFYESAIRGASVVQWPDWDFAFFWILLFFRPFNGSSLFQPSTFVYYLICRHMKSCLNPNTSHAPNFKFEKCTKILRLILEYIRYVPNRPAPPSVLPMHLTHIAPRQRGQQTVYRQCKASPDAEHGTKMNDTQHETTVWEQTDAFWLRVMEVMC